MSDLSPPAFDPRQLVLPSVLAMLHEVQRLLPPLPHAHLGQAQQVLAQIGQALRSVQLPGPAQLIDTMGQVLQQHGTLLQQVPDGQDSAAGTEPSTAAQGTTDADGGRILALLRLACQDMERHLQALEQGQPSDNQLLFDAYRALVRLGGKDSAHPADLWPPRGQAQQAVLPPALLAAAPPLEPTDEARAMLDQAVLAWVKTGDRALAAQLRSMCLGLSQTAPTQALCSAWQLLAAWLDAQAQGLLAADMYAKRLAARLLMLYGQQIKGGTTPGAPMLREVLFFCDQASQRLVAHIDTNTDTDTDTAHVLVAICRSCGLLPEPQPDPEPAAAPAMAPAEPPAPLPLPAIALDTWQPAAIELQPVATLGQGMAALPQVQAPPNALQPAQACAQDLQQALQHWIAAAPEATKTDAITLAAQLTRDAWEAGWAEVATLAHLLQRVLERSPILAAEQPELSSHCLHGCADLQRLLQQLGQGFVRRAHPPVVQALEQWLRTLAPLPTEDAEPPPAASPEAIAQTPEKEAESAQPASVNGQKDDDFLPADLPPTLHPQHFAVLEEEMLAQWPVLEAALTEWQRAPQRCSPAGLLRALHTLKGSARLAGAQAWASQVHALESLAFAPDCTPASLMVPIQTLHLGFVALQQEMDMRYPQRKAQPPQPLERLQHHTQALWATQADVQRSHQQSQTALAEAHTSLHRLRHLLADCDAWSDALVVQGGMDMSYEWHAELGDLLRHLRDAADDLGTVQQQLQHYQQATAHHLEAQSCSLSALQHSLLYARQQPLQHLEPRLQECVQLAARDCGKHAHLSLEGGDIRLEPDTLLALAPALEHVLRNCLAHGIEPPDQRTQMGKPATGQIVLRLQVQEGKYLLEVHDDGAGLHREAIGNKARALGLWPHSAAPSDAEAASLILHPGLSTAQGVDQVAGRGIGMDAVLAQVRLLGGQLHIDSHRGQGCCVRVTLPAPARIETLQAVRAGSWLVALPGSCIEGVRRIPLAAAQYALDQGMLPGDARGPLPLFWAGALWQQSSHSQETPIDQHALIVVVRSSTQRWGLWVDELLPPHEAVLQPPAGLRTPVVGLLGTAAFPSGQVLQVYAPAPVIAAHEARLQAQQSAATPAASPSVADDGEANAPWIMLVDDSISVRRLAQHLLASDGWRVATAADGLDALAQLQAGLEPALLLVDIEMPGMDGLELLRRLRSQPQWQALSVVMLTAHEAGPVSQQALDMGAQAYLTKPYSPQQLLAQVRRYAGALPSPQA